MKKLAIALCVFLIAVLGPLPAQAASKISFTLDFWADNWAAVYVNGIKVAEDPVSITTTKSFNKVSATFSATYPLRIAVIAKDYVENKSGLEYIGTPQQQIGDAGLMMQIHEKSSGKLVAYSNKAWRSYVLFRAPLNPTCVTSAQPLTDCQSTVKSTPASWYSTSFNYSSWPTSTAYTAAQVGPKDGYYEVNWDARANFIWSSSLTLDNTVLFRTQATGPISTAAPFQLNAPYITASTLSKDNTCDGVGTLPTLSWTTPPSGSQSLLLIMDTPAGPVRPGEVAQTDFTHLVQYNIPAKAGTLTSKLELGSPGKNFKGALGYTPPCSQGPGDKAYTFHLYALSGQLTGSALTGTAALAAAKALLLAETAVTLHYSRG